MVDHSMLGNLSLIFIFICFLLVTRKLGIRLCGHLQAYSKDKLHLW